MTDHSAPAGNPIPRKPRRRATIDDVAAIAGVSRGTVSRAINGGRDVSAAAAAAVARAMLETGYSVNHSARSLVTRRTNCAAFVVSEQHEQVFEDPNFNVLLRSATQSLAARGFSLILMIAGTGEDRERVLTYLRAGHVDGALLVSTHSEDPLVPALQRDHLPFVVCGRPLGPVGEVPFVAADDREGGRLMTQYLVDLGRKRVGTITGPLDTSGGTERLRGYFDAVGSRKPRSLIVNAKEYSFAAGHAAMLALYEQSPQVDAVFVASDLMAAGALAALRSLGRRVPEDIAVAGFDDSRLATTTEPPLTTVRQPLDRVADEMVRLLLDLIEGGSPASVVLPVEVVPRQSA